MTIPGKKERDKYVWRQQSEDHKKTKIWEQDKEIPDTDDESTDSK